MKKLCLVVVGLYIGLLSCFAQSTDTTNYKKKKLKIDEVNFLTSYYHQDGDNSAVTGGVGTEKLTDFANNIELKFIKYDKHTRKRTLNCNLGIDYYTSASSDKIDPKTISSASGHDLRIYPSVEYGIENEKKRKKINFNLSLSGESDYKSFGIGAGFSKQSKDKSREYSVKANAFIDEVKIILPYELRDATTGGFYGAPNEYDYPWRSRNTFSASFSVSQIINKRWQMMLLWDIVDQEGFLSMPFHRIYFVDTSKVGTEQLPSSRFKIPIGIRSSYFMGDNIIIRAFYRFYHDNWGLNAHTIDLETAVKVNPFFSVSPFYRFYTQNGIDYFAPIATHSITERYYSSNYDLSDFNSHFFGAGLRWVPVKKIVSAKQVELRYGHYIRSNSLHSDVVSLYLKF